MAKDTKIQIRIDSDRKEWLKKYAEDKEITITQMFIDFIDWLKEKGTNDK